MHFRIVPEEVVFGLVSVSLPIVLMTYFSARRVMRMIMRQRMQELVFEERLAWMRRGVVVSTTSGAAPKDGATRS